jgi:ABC-type multidrug transport system fused ATPase/permease subunit
MVLDDGKLVEFGGYEELMKFEGGVLKGLVREFLVCIWGHLSIYVI